MHLLVLGDERTGCDLRRAGLIIRDSILIVQPGPTLAVAWLVRAPVDGPLAREILRSGGGALHLDACRIALEAGEEISNHARSAAAAKSKGIYGNSRAQATHTTEGQRIGRWPTNVIFVHVEDDVLASFEEIRFYPRFGTMKEAVDWLNRLTV